MFAFVLCVATTVVVIAVVNTALDYPSSYFLVKNKAEIQIPALHLIAKQHKRAATVNNIFNDSSCALNTFHNETTSGPSLHYNHSSHPERKVLSLAKTAVLCTTNSTLGCVTNNPFNDPAIQVSTTTIPFADAKPVSCPDRLCLHYALADKKHMSCWNTGKKRIALDDTEFRCRFMNETGRAPVGLVSFPGSGNTWVRGLLEQVTGYCTGSVYCDVGLLEKGFAGEYIQNSAVIVVKTHAISPLWHNESASVKPLKGPHFSGIIFIIRNLFDALKAEMNRQVYNKHHQGSQSWKSHVSTAGNQRFGEISSQSVLISYCYIFCVTGSNKVWTKFVRSMAPQWLAMIKNWVAGNRGHPVLVIRYEDIKLNPVREVKKMLRFLNVEYDDYKVEERMQKDFSIYHRQWKKIGDVYSKKLREFVNTILSEAETFINDNGLEHVVQISDYH